MKPTSFEEARRAHEDTTFRGPGRTDRRLREALAERKDIPADLEALVTKIEREPWRVTDADITTLKAKYSDDELFEIVVSAALGASSRRLDAALRALEEA
jgi:hypothetical protein